MRRDDICLYLSPANRAKLEALIADRNTSAKVVWRAEIVLATVDGLGTNAIMLRTGKSKPCVWRWQERYIAEASTASCATRRARHASSRWRPR